MDTPGISNLLFGLSLRAPRAAIRTGQRCRCEVRTPSHQVEWLRVWGCLPKKAALYTMKTPSEQRLTRAVGNALGTGRS